MKKWCIWLLCLLLLPGCSAVETFETLGVIAHTEPAPAPIRPVVLMMPADAVRSTLSAGPDLLYECGEYSILLQTRQSGDLSATIMGLSGFAPDHLTVVCSSCGDHDRYDWVWSAAGEDTDLLCRAAVLDDGAYHYCLLVMAPESVSGELTEQWNQLFGSFCLEAQ